MKSLKINRKVLKMIIAGSVLTAGVAVPTLAVVACGSSTTTTTVEPIGIPNYAWAAGAPDIRGKSVISIMPDPENPRYQRAAQYLRASGTEAGLVNPDGSVQIQKTSDQQNNLLGNSLKADGYILGGSENSTFAAGMNTIGADAKKAPIVAYDRLLNAETPTYNWYVTFQTRIVGRMQGLFIIKKLYSLDDTALPYTASDADVTAAVGKATKLTTPKLIVAVSGSPSDNNAKDYLGGAEDVIDAAIVSDPMIQKPAAQLTNGKWLQTNGSAWSSLTAQKDWDYEAGRTYLQTILTGLSASQKSQVAAILSPNDGMALSAITAVRYANLDPTNIWITGQDANDSGIISITNGTGQDMTVAKPDYALARVAMAVLAKLMVMPAATPQQVLASVTATYPALSQYSPKLDTTNYKLPTPSTKVINAILLNPVVVDKTNVEQLFKITTVTS